MLNMILAGQCSPSILRVREGLRNEIIGSKITVAVLHLFCNSGVKIIC